MLRLSYARVLIEVNLMDVLPYSINILLPNGSILNQSIVYETLPKFCKHCRVLSHNIASCSSLAGSSQQTQGNEEYENRSRGSVLQKLCPLRDKHIREKLSNEQFSDPMQVEATTGDREVV
jgi:hypothetical protein